MYLFLTVYFCNSVSSFLTFFVFPLKINGEAATVIPWSSINSNSFISLWQNHTALSRLCLQDLVTCQHNVHKLINNLGHRIPHNCHHPSHLQSRMLNQSLSRSQKIDIYKNFVKDIITPSGGYRFSCNIAVVDNDIGNKIRVFDIFTPCPVPLTYISCATTAYARSKALQ